MGSPLGEVRELTSEVRDRVVSGSGPSCPVVACVCKRVAQAAMWASMGKKADGRSWRGNGCRERIDEELFGAFMRCVDFGVRLFG